MPRLVVSMQEILNADPDAFYYPQTASRLLTKEERENMNQTDRSIARNEMFARHGGRLRNRFYKVYPIKLDSPRDYNEVRAKYLGENAKEAERQNPADFAN